MTLIEIFNNIANAIRYKLNTTDKMLVEDMSDKIRSISSNTISSGYLLEIKTYPNSIVTVSKEGNTIKSTTSDSNGIANIYFNDNDDNGIWNININKDGLEYNDTWSYDVYLKSTKVCMYGGLSKYNGTVEELSAARYWLAATTVGNYALFGGGGKTNNVYTPMVDSYTSSLTHGNPNNLSDTKIHYDATTVGNYALFAGGSYNTIVVDTYTSSITKGTAADLSKARYHLAATSVGNYALFGGGNDSTNTAYATVDTYNTSLSKSTAKDFSQPRSKLAATTVGNYALFAGGHAYITSNYIETYDVGLSKGITSFIMNLIKYDLSATTVGSYALFGGGYAGGDYTPLVTGITSSLSKVAVDNLSENTFTKGAATTVANYAVFGGGSNTNGNGAVDNYNISLTKSTSAPFGYYISDLAATSVGDYAIFGGGMDKTPASSKVVNIYIATD